MGILVGNEELSSLGKTTQVYQATHDGAGESLLHLEKSFISFTFGGKSIEDFGLIVVNSGDRLERQAYSSFSDLTSNYDTLDGQLYWGSHFEAGQLELALATDEMTERQLDDFREWFAPGKERELILSEHPNRAILARVAAAPVYSFLPFEQKTTVVINNSNYETSTTVYRGEVSLSFIMSEPYWYGKLNYMPEYINKITLEPLQIDSVDENKINSLTSKDMYKIIFEDGIPYQTQLTIDMFLGTNMVVSQEARVDQVYVDQVRLGITTSSNLEGITISSNNDGYLFYSGTAPSLPVIQFSITPEFDNSGYLVYPVNKISNSNLTEYSYISVGDKKFYFTTPSLLTGYNKAIQIFNGIISDISKVELLEVIKTSINEYYSRAWAVQCVNSINNDVITSSDINTLCANMKEFFEVTDENENTIYPDFTFVINSKTGEAIGNFDLNQGTITQNVGDMIRSNYLVIEGRNHLNSNGGISTENCKKISSNLELKKVLFFYKNMYL